jgi:hypothetical protein
MYGSDSARKKTALPEKPEESIAPWLATKNSLGRLFVTDQGFFILMCDDDYD